MRKMLIVVDMQNDFIDGALGTKEAVGILPCVVAKIEEYKARGGVILATLDTHGDNYMDTSEGKNLPVPHCIRGTAGWQIIPELQDLTEGCMVLDKPTFGSVELCRMLTGREDMERITLIGLCTDICVISNALLCKAALPEVPVAVEPACCAGVTVASHENALNAMKMCQIIV